MTHLRLFRHDLYLRILFYDGACNRSKQDTLIHTKKVICMSTTCDYKM